jgi:hypothetical protein
LTNKIAAALLLFLTLAVAARAELLKVSLLEKPVPPFTLKQDIFNGAVSAGDDSRPGMQPGQPPAQAAAAQKTIAEEIFQSVIYEGYVMKNAKKSALLNVSGEFYMVSEQDQILDKIKILKITKNIVTIEYENQPYDIKLKGDENGEVK